ncbi:hypothetical protein PoB_004330000 [Plakobranchus ocellatus]|uniref:VWFD domain-containing protein n=1 Tax=Plakobranchus ocellatus TaxID=259542 RepID=A0AAV4B884_9GAST|nr:hypothetical protein PoB_004330000 [Plakobranchus ocellatus]
MSVSAGEESLATATLSVILQTSIEVKNDPSVLTATKEMFQLPVSCRYLLTHFRSRYTPLVGSRCEVKVHGFNRKHKGKVYLYGIDIALRVSTPLSATPVGDISWRFLGTCTGGRYEFTERGSQSYVPDGPWPRSDLTYLYIPGANIFPRYDFYNNMIYVKYKDFSGQVDACGFNIRFRPSDTSLGKRQLQVPGVSVVIRTDGKFMMVQSAPGARGGVRTDILDSSLKSKKLNRNRPAINCYGLKSYHQSTWLESGGVRTDIMDSSLKSKKLNRNRPAINCYGLTSYHQNTWLESGTEWLSRTDVMGLQPDGRDLKDLAQDSNLHPPHFMLLRMFESNATQNQPGAAKACSAITDTVKSCTDTSARKAAIARCFFILKRSKFVRCYDKGYKGGRILSLFNECFSAICGGSEAQCRATRQKLEECAFGNIPNAEVLLADLC